MDRLVNKPTKHSADHLPGGQDPIPGLGFAKLELIQDGSATMPANGSGVALPWQHLSGDSLLDLTTPTQPLIKEDGSYIIAAWVADVTPSVPSSDASLFAKLILDVGGAGIQIAGLAPENTAITGHSGFLQSSVPLCAPYLFTAGMAIALEAAQSSGADRVANIQFAIVAKVL